ncbi:MULTISPECIES: DUF4012 domain-containing protein [unclassified Cryobacterium]|uniref:DUF4012 domain-containing protein n=1 Tax=unclassified Cryobacterium TaxID=2649013 RepID=UPI00106AF647|nr:MULTISPECIES: DUF4012 domain-containing protein [unclassified Cryobacterium]TFC55100.1 DUF4012 domain-containing protein [Cryobacterium sp. TMB3-1-2]TFC67172.1 DUF4012 domain-containing protein [Cryobacterium sp. TMB3-15]TFC73315.1 DUF4012 domain-containing protein [Cryobacterium sp. TMB3-10]TFD44270.1 DUF4012 domain-containing protein [Cryobacterium sp. TMB3-12]
MTDSIADRASAVPNRPRRRKQRPRRALIILAVCVGLVVVVGAAAGWVGSRVLTAKAELEQAQVLVGTLKSQATAMDFVGLGATSTKLSAATSKAVDQTQDPIWRAAEIVPIAGPNLSAVRQLAEAVDVVAKEAVAPVAEVASGLSAASLKPVDGKINLTPILSLNTALTTASAALDSAAESVAAIELDGTVAQVDAAGTQFGTLLDSAATTVGDVRSIASVVPDMLGASGPRSYILIFQNLAESTALGGTAAALTEVTVDNGQISIARQASSQTFPWRDGEPVIAEDPKLAALYSPLIYTRLNLATSRPDFPTAAQITQAFWQQDLGGTVDGVISIDPAALAHMLGATGPVAMSTGDVLTEDNAVALLLNEIYFRYQGKNGPDQTDAFFAEAAMTMFNAVTNSQGEPVDMLNAVSQGVNEHRIMAWSAHPEEQKILEGTPMAGILPASNEAATTTGVFFRDTSTSKMDFYLETGATLSTDVCTAATPTFTTKVDLHSTLTEELAEKLPSYVATEYWGADQFRTEVYVYGPPGTSFVSAGVAEGADLLATTDDLGRPVAKFNVMLTPGQTSQVTATFAGLAGTYGEPMLRTTPMLNPTTVAVDAPGCK